MEALGYLENIFQVFVGYLNCFQEFGVFIEEWPISSSPQRHMARFAVRQTRTEVGMRAQMFMRECLPRSR
jgi:hypothetical protein